MKWFKDSNGNQCSVSYFGSEKKAQEALDSLTQCRDCVNCFDCSGCSRCSECEGCVDSVGLSNCVDCVACSDCVDCASCSRCFDLRGGVHNKGAEIVGLPPVPIIPDIHKAVYAASSQPESLAMDQVHTCENKHCRAGWVIFLAGEAGKSLEKFYDWNVAARKIYDASAPGFKINPSRFFDSNDEALADMKALAGL